MTTSPKQPTAKHKPVHVIRQGDVSAEVYLRQSNCGYPYYDFLLSRSFKSMTTGKEANSSTFFDKNEQDLVRLIQKACQWIREKMVTTPASQVPTTRGQSRPTARHQQDSESSTPDA